MKITNFLGVALAFVSLCFSSSGWGSHQVTTPEGVCTEFLMAAGCVTVSGESEACMCPDGAASAPAGAVPDGQSSGTNQTTAPTATQTVAPAKATATQTADCMSTLTPSTPCTDASPFVGCERCLAPASMNRSPGDVSGGNPSGSYNLGFCKKVAAAVDQCWQDAIPAEEDSCNPSKNGKVQSTLQMADKLTQIGSMVTVSMTDSCSKMNELSSMANLAMLGFKGYCAMAEKKCKTSCGEVENLGGRDVAAACSDKTLDVTQRYGYKYSRADRSCNASTQALADADKNIMMMMMSKARMTQCQMQTDAAAKLAAQQAADQAAADKLAADLRALQDCNNPQTGSTNRVCICQRNPNDPVCANGPASADPAATTGLPANTASAADNKNLLNGLNLGGNNPSALDAIGPARPGGNGAGASGGGKGVSRVGGGGGDAPSTAGNKGGGAPAARGDAPKINAGYYGGSGGGGFSGGGGYGSGGSNGNGQQAVDLKQFLPGGAKDPSKRGLASGPDGISGQGTDIWKKINGRYWAVSPEMRQ